MYTKVILTNKRRTHAQSNYTDTKLKGWFRRLLRHPRPGNGVTLFYTPQTHTGEITGMTNKYGLRGEDLAWLIGAVVCLLAAPWIQLLFARRASNDRISLVHANQPKALLVTSLTRISSAVRTFAVKFGPNFPL